MGQASMRKWSRRARESDTVRNPTAAMRLALRMRREFRQERRVELAIRNGKRYDFRNVVASFVGVTLQEVRSLTYDADTARNVGAFRPASVSYASAEA